MFPGNGVKHKARTSTRVTRRTWSTTEFPVPGTQAFRWLLRSPKNKPFVLSGALTRLPYANLEPDHRAKAVGLGVTSYWKLRWAFSILSSVTFYENVTASSRAWLECQLQSSPFHFQIAETWNHARHRRRLSKCPCKGHILIYSHSNPRKHIKCFL